MTNFTNNKKFKKVNRTIIYILIILSITIHTGMKVEAYPIQGYVTGNSVNVRKGDSTSYASIGKLNKEHPVTVLEQSSKTSWYKIEFNLNGKTMQGWMSNQYIRLDVEYTEDTNFEDYLNKQKFPESYKPYLRDLHALHPNWEFVALHTGLGWDDVVRNQTNPVYRSLVPSSSIASWKSLEKGAYNWDKGTWTNFEPGWVAASSEIVQYFMDPRNSLVSSGEVLQYLSLGWTGKETKAGVQNIIKGSFMDKSNLDYAQYFMDAGRANGVSPYHLATRVIQEVGVNGSGSVKGPYYNFYNIGATGNNPVQAAIKYAKGQGWNTPKKAITEGAKFITNGYINTGQDTLYLQKFDVVDGGNGYYWHQYMTNIQAPTNEAKNMRKTFPDFNNGHLILKIPVYKNMPSTACIKPSSTGSPNNLLSSLSVNSYSLTPFFNKFNTTYDLIVPDNVSSITVVAKPVLSTTKVTGTGKHNLKSGSNVIKITSKAQNGQSIDYIINVSRGKVETPSPPNNSGGTNISSKYNITSNITGVAPGTSVDSFKKNIKVNDATVEVVNSDGTRRTGSVGTGSILQIKKDNKVVDQYPVVIYGDNNGDGVINIVDLANIQKHILNVSKLQGVYLEAANTKKKGNELTILDLANVQKHILKVSLISQ